MKKLMVATLALFSLLLPTKLSPSGKKDTAEKGEVRVLVNEQTGETVRVRMSDPSYWNWVDPKLSEWLDSSAAEIEKSKTRAETLYFPPIYRGKPDAVRKMEIVFSPSIIKIAEELGYRGAWSWGNVGKKIITAYEQSPYYDQNKDEVMDFREAVDASSDCFAYAGFLFTLMRNVGFKPSIFEIQEGWFKESGEEDSIVITQGSWFTGHEILYLKPNIYDNESAYPKKAGGNGTGFVPAGEYNLEDVCTPPSLSDSFLRNYGWFPAIFIFTAKPYPWEIKAVEITDTSHPLAFQLIKCKENHSMWVVRGMEAEYYRFGPVTIVDTTRRKEKWIMEYNGVLDTVDVEITFSEDVLEKNYAIVFSPEAKEMVDEIIKGMSSAQK